MSGIPNSIWNSKQPILKKYAQGQATDKQLNYLRKLGGNPNEGMTKEQVSIEIDKFIRLKEGSFDYDEPEETNESPISTQLVTEPKEVDTDEAGVDSEGFL